MKIETKIRYNLIYEGVLGVIYFAMAKDYFGRFFVVLNHTLYSTQSIWQTSEA